MKSCIIIQAAGEHNGTTKLCKNDYLRESLSLKYAFEQNDIKADVWGKRFPNFNNPPDFNSYDYLINLENYEMDWLPDFSKITKPIKMQWIIDLHYQPDEIYQRFTPNMDIVLHSTKSLMKHYQKFFPNKRHIWFPNGFDERYFKNFDKNKKEDLIFIGNVCNRGPLLKMMKENYGMNYYMITGKDMIDKISETKIHFNKSISVDVNYRNFETLGLGTCLLTNYLSELEELGFKDGENCFMYKNINEIPYKIKEAKENNKWKIVGKNGLKFSKNHTYTKRIENLLKEI